MEIDVINTHHQNTARISKYRIYFLQFIYLATFISLGRFAWLEIFTHTQRLENFYGVTISLWAGYATLMAFGVYRPLKMIPMLILQLIYKSTWLLGVALPMWSAGTLDPTTSYWIKSWSFAVLINALVLPWPYIYQHFIKRRK
mgnify:CR=1 FL=1